jgi:hypothetical protein
MNGLKTVVTAGIALLALSGPTFAFQCPADIAAIDQALQTADLSEEQRQRVVELRNEGERLHEAGDHQASVDTLAQAKEVLGIE